MTAPQDPSLNSNTSASLLLRLRGNGEAREVAWQEFFNLYQPIICAFARRMGASWQETEELVAEVMRSFFCVSPEFRYDPEKGRFRGYLKTCVCNKLSAMRKRSSALTTAPNASELLDQVAVESTWNDVWETEKLQRAVATVRHRYANNAQRAKTFRAFELCTLLDRSTEEVAAELQLSAESVRAAKSRVSKAVRQAFDSLDDVTG